jgi:hypothetical protein
MAKNKSTHFRRKNLTNIDQALRLKTVFPDSRFDLARNFGLNWVGRIHPMPLGGTYTVQISYRLKQRPEVSILDPILVGRNGSRLPHVFSGNHPCLFRFKYREWDGAMYIADTIVPWVATWLVHYEVWLATGVWCGSKQEHPGDEGKNGSC